LLVVVLAVAVGLGLVFARGSAFATTTTPSLTSAEIADAVLFNDGPAARYLAAIDREPVRWTDELRSVQAGVRSALAADPTGYYTSAFAVAMQSGDPRAVRAALERLGETVHTYLKQRYGQEKLDDALRVIGADGFMKPPTLEVEIDVVHVAVTASVAILAVAVTIIILLVVIIPFRDGSDEGLLEAEKMTNDIAAGLRLDR
jgi:hypothetical protein